MYGRLINGEIEYFTKKELVVGRRRIINPKRKHLIEIGYKEVVFDDLPKGINGGEIKVEYKEDGDSIRVVYSVKERTK